jgi:Mn-dependent DtxR family transcriptional regulator
MDEKKKEIIVTELTLFLIYLTGWEEDKRNAPGEKVFRAWKGYTFEALDELQGKGLIWQIPGGKSLLLNDKGKQKATELIKKYIDI